MRQLDVASTLLSTRAARRRPSSTMLSRVWRSLRRQGCCKRYEESLKPASPSWSCRLQTIQSVAMSKVLELHIPVNKSAACSRPAHGVHSVTAGLHMSTGSPRLPAGANHACTGARQHPQILCMVSAFRGSCHTMASTTCRGGQG